MDYQLGLYEKAMPAGLSWDEMLFGAKLAGFDFVEISIDESEARLARLDWTQAKRMAVLRATQENGLPIRTMCLSGHRKYPLGSHDAATRERGMAIFRKAIDLAGDLGIRIIQLAGYDVYYEQGDALTRELFASNLRRCVDIASMHGVLLGFETMETPFMDTIAKAMQYVRAVDSPYLGVYPDLGNLTNAGKLYGFDPAEELEIGRGHIVAMHIKETRPGQYREVAFGTGHVDFVRGIAKAQAMGVNSFVAECWYDGAVDWKQNLCEVNQFVRRQCATIRPA